MHIAILVHFQPIGYIEYSSSQFLLGKQPNVSYV